MHFQTMYCSENCLIADSSSAHKSECNKLSRPLTLKFDELTTCLGTEKSQALTIKSMMVRLISRIGLDNIKKTVLENKPLQSFADPRTKGFQDGKLQTGSLEALLSLEDNFDKLTKEELFKMSVVSLVI
jgi:hypothetical protein